MKTPLVTVICLSYNHAQFVVEALESVFQQQYKNIELIVVDDASTDDSAQVIRTTLAGRKQVVFIPLQENVGNCRAFNVAFKRSSGEYVIDFSADDVMSAGMISRQIQFFQTLDPSFGVVFTDAVYIDEHGRKLHEHFRSLIAKGRIERIPQGDIYGDVLSTYFIPSPTMMIRREVLLTLNGYDEDLAYEDFDFWVRASRNYKFALLDEKLMSIRLSPTSMSKSLYRKGDRQLHSTYLVCMKAFSLNRNEAERQALITRVRYELRHAVFSDNQKEAELFGQLLLRLDGGSFLSTFLLKMGKLNLPLGLFRKVYMKFRS
jgi:glycosyltransferase involved in cell wall biosynthesis